MSKIPPIITKSGLWKQLGQHPDFPKALEGLREIAEKIAAKAVETLPEYTDHSVTHMDALWRVADQVFISEEIQQFTPGEAFILACSFYVHDLGMALAATAKGREELEQSEVYSSTYERLRASGYEEEAAKVEALKIAARDLHAHKAKTLIDEKFPGLDRYLIETTELREKWGSFIGQVAASHHWSIQQLDKELGKRGKVPDSIGGTIDLGFVACALRIIDYAHINAARASTLDRLLRKHIGSESLKHWAAQEHITGPAREGQNLVFGSTRPIKDVDAWWTFYEMAKGLDIEITSVADYLNSRSVSVGRFSLEGIKAIKIPQSFAALVQTEGFEPVDVQFRPDSMERLITLLGGRTLYGDDHFAAIRELLQNARDAILLRQAFAEVHGDTPVPGEINVKIEKNEEGGMLSVTDNGVGMSVRVITNYLLGVASDYWHSPDFHVDYPGVAAKGFSPAGRFGIGFLSVFMMGKDVEIQTQTQGGPNLTLRLHGVGQRGSLITNPNSTRVGTTVSVQIPKESLSDYTNLSEIVRAKAPMLRVSVSVTQEETETTIAPGWWKKITQDELLLLVKKQHLVATTPQRDREEKEKKEEGSYRWYRDPTRAATLDELDINEKWPGQQPEIIAESYRILAIPHLNKVVLCSHGLAIGHSVIPGMSGIIEIGEVELNVARSQPLEFEWKVSEFQDTLRDILHSSILEGLDRIKEEGDIPWRYNFLSEVENQYGTDLLIKTGLPWINIVKPPGHSILMSPDDLSSYVSVNQGVLILLLDEEDSDRWGEIRECRRYYPEAESDTVVIVLPPVHNLARDGDHDPYEYVIVAPFPDFLSENVEVEDIPLLFPLLQILARSWDTTVEQLCGRKWTRYREILYGYLCIP